MNWRRSTAVAITIVVCVGCNRVPGVIKAGSVITASSTKSARSTFTFSVVVSGDDWTCDADDCRTMYPANSTLIILKNDTPFDSISMQPGWSVDIFPHFAKLELVSGYLHIYANRKDDKWKKSDDKTITHGDQSIQIRRIVATDPTKRYKPDDLCGPDEDPCKVTFTIGK